MSLLPLMFSDWWEDLDRPHQLLDQHFGLNLDPDDLSDRHWPDNAEILPYRPYYRRSRRRYHPFPRSAGRKSHGTSTIQANKDKFLVTLDVQQFAPEEISVKVIDKYVVVEAKHDEKKDEHGYVSRQFGRRYLIPSQCDSEQVQSSLSSDGVLTITAPRKEPPKESNAERVIKIQYTGHPAVTNCDGSGEPMEIQKELAQQRTQQQQGQRGKKNVTKAG